MNIPKENHYLPTKGNPKVYQKDFLLEFRGKNTNCPIQLQEEEWKLFKSASSSSCEEPVYEKFPESELQVPKISKTRLY